MEGSGFFDESFNRVKSAVYGRNRPTPKLKKFLDLYGDRKIVKLKIVRSPIEKSLQIMANAISFGNWNSVKKKLNYDQIFHLGVWFLLDNDVSGILEKNHVIQINSVNLDKIYEYYPLSVPSITLNDFFNNAKRYYKSLKEFFDYNAKNNNCQRFVLALLNGNNINNKENEEFVYQNAVSILKDSPFLETFINLGTDIAKKIDILLFGGRL